MAHKKGVKRPKQYTINGKKVTPGKRIQQILDRLTRNRKKPSGKTRKPGKAPGPGKVYRKRTGKG